MSNGTSYACYGVTMLAAIKSFVRDQLGIPPLVVLALAGVLLHFCVNLLLRKAPTSTWGLLGPLAAGLVLESWEIWVQYHEAGLFAPGNDPLPVILGRHAIDVLVLLAVPALIVAAGWVAAR